MPEGPEVALIAEYLSELIVGKFLTKISVISGRYFNKEIPGLSLINLPLKTLKVDSKGKFLWISFNNFVYLQNTFGLSGKWLLNPSDKTMSRRVDLEFTDEDSNKIIICYVDARNFGTIEFSDKLKLVNKLKKISYDALKSDITHDDMVKLFLSYKSKHKSHNIVKLLMDQNAVVSGIGNYIVAEVLYDSSIDPHLTIGNISDDKINSLVTSIRKIMKCSYCYNMTEYTKSMESIKLGKNTNYISDIDAYPRKLHVYGKKKDPYGKKVSTDEIIKGRKIYYVNLNN
jgi:DNA-formamidopyrimidine glycosylase